MLLHKAKRRSNRSGVIYQNSFVKFVLSVCFVNAYNDKQ
jgi:hypothetical protein